jgi:Uma2 family endonuclease
MLTRMKERNCDRRARSDGLAVQAAHDRRSTSMATVPRQHRTREINYPTSDGKPMAETDIHRDDMVDLIQTLQDYFAGRRRAYVSGNLLLYYEEGNPRKHVAPDVLVALDLDQEPRRDYFLVWKEGKAPDLVMEITSKTTKREDQTKKPILYRETLKVREYILFDPTEDYLTPSLQGFRLTAGEYAVIAPVAGRLPSEVLGLHLERDGQQLRLFDPATSTRLLTPREGRAAATARAAAETVRAAAADAARQELAAENEQLRREIEALRGRR